MDVSKVRLRKDFQSRSWAGAAQLGDPEAALDWPLLMITKPFCHWQSLRDFLASEAGGIGAAEAEGLFYSHSSPLCVQQGWHVPAPKLTPPASPCHQQGQQPAQLLAEGVTPRHTILQRQRVPVLLPWFGKTGVC